MDSTYLSLIIFLAATLLYFALFKSKMEISQIDQPDGLYNYIKTNFVRLGAYFMLVLVSQFTINCFAIIDKCGGNAQTNIGTAFIMTFIPWVFIFGTLVAVLIMFPSIKAMFSNVIGYFVVAARTNILLADLLINSKIDSQMDNIAASDSGSKKALQGTADAILKLVGNASIIINQITPANFIQYWEVLKPLMKPEYRDNQEAKQELLNIVSLRDDVGEACWYIYTAILLTSFIQYNMATNACKKDSASIEADYKKFQQQEDDIKKQQDLAKSQVYTIKT